MDEASGPLRTCPVQPPTPAAPPSPSRGSGRRAGRRRRLSAAASGPELPPGRTLGSEPLWEGQQRPEPGRRETGGETDTSTHQHQVPQDDTHHHVPTLMQSLPGEKMSGLKRTSKAVLLMEPTALHALRITSRLRGSAVETRPAGRQLPSTSCATPSLPQLRSETRAGLPWAGSGFPHPRRPPAPAAGTEAGLGPPRIPSSPTCPVVRGDGLR